MPKPSAWRIVRWLNRPVRTTIIDLSCPDCDHDATLVIGFPGSPIIAAFGLSLVFDDPSYKPPVNMLPTVIRCTHCRRTYGQKLKAG